MFTERSQKSQITRDDWILGRADSAVTILEYGDFECPYCAAIRPILQGLVAEYPDKIHLVYRHFPVTTTHPHALIAAESAEAAGAQDRFWRMHDLLFTHQKRLEFDNLRAYAREIGLEVPRFDREMTAHRYEDEVQKDFRRGIEDGANGTPSIFINGLRYDGAQERASLLSAIAAQVPT